MQVLLAAAVCNKTGKGAPLCHKFLPHSAMLAQYMLSSCICLSQSSTKVAKPRITQTTLFDSPETLVFEGQKPLKFHGITPNRGAK